MAAPQGLAGGVVAGEAARRAPPADHRAGELRAAAGRWVTAPAASACSCAGLTTVEQFDAADVVLTGSLLSREVLHPPGPIWSSADPAVHLVAVQTLSTGVAAAQQQVVSADSGASCGLELAGD